MLRVFACTPSPWHNYSRTVLRSHFLTHAHAVCTKSADFKVSKIPKKEMLAHVTFFFFFCAWDVNCEPITIVRATLLKGEIWGWPPQRWPLPATILAQHAFSVPHYKVHFKTYMPAFTCMQHRRWTCSLKCKARAQQWRHLPNTATCPMLWSNTFQVVRAALKIFTSASSVLTNQLLEVEGALWWSKLPSVVSPTVEIRQGMSCLGWQIKGHLSCH